LAVGTWRVVAGAAYGRFETSHVASCPDVAPECATIPIPDHEHHVTLDLIHTGFSVDYGLTRGLTASLRVPYDIKNQTVRYTTLDGQPYVPPYGDIHHRTEAPRGVGDLQLTALFPLGPFLVGAGLWLPTGRTVPNPIVLGREGKTHDHIQFGSGTVDPLLSVLWSQPVGRFTLRATADAQIPLYENRHGFKAPVTVRYAAGPHLFVGSADLSVEYAGQYQSIGRWDGEVDEGTGFHNGGVFLRATFPIGNGVYVAPGLYQEIYSKSLSEETFKQNTTFALTLTRFF
jgi:hypothetical protein